MPPVELTVLMPLPAGLSMCNPCEVLIAQAELDKPPSERGLDEYPPEWQAEFQRFSEAIFEISARFGSSVLIRIWDPRSLQGLIKAIRFGAHRYPAFIVAGRHKVTELDVPQLEQALLAAGATLQPA